MRSYSYTTINTVTVEDVYGISNPPIPIGWKDVEFRNYREGEGYLLPNTISGAATVASADGPRDEPRIILKAVPTKVVYRYTETRHPKFGEYVLGDDGHIHSWRITYDKPQILPIMVREDS